MKRMLRESRYFSSKIYSKKSIRVGTKTHVPSCNRSAPRRRGPFPRLQSGRVPRRAASACCRCRRSMERAGVSARRPHLRAHRQRGRHDGRFRALRQGDPCAEEGAQRRSSWRTITDPGDLHCVADFVGDSLQPRARRARSMPTIIVQSACISWPRPPRSQIPRDRADPDRRRLLDWPLDRRRGTCGCWRQRFPDVPVVGAYVNLGRREGGGRYPACPSSNALQVYREPPASERVISCPISIWRSYVASLTTMKIIIAGRAPARCMSASTGEGVRRDPRRPIRLCRSSPPEWPAPTLLEEADYTGVDPGMIDWGCAQKTVRRVVMVTECSMARQRGRRVARIELAGPANRLPAQKRITPAQDSRQPRLSQGGGRDRPGDSPQGAGALVERMVNLKG